MNIVVNGKQEVRSPSNITNVKKTRSPSPVEKLNWLVHLQHVRGEIANCKELIKSEIKKSNGRNEYAFFKQGTILKEEEKLQEALESFQMCLKLNPKNTDNLKEVAKCLFLLRRYRLSLEAYLEAERCAERPDWEIYYNIGQCLIRLGDTTKAKDYARKAVQIGKHECCFSLLIKILVGEGDMRSAISVCNTAIEACPDSVHILTESGLLHLKTGQTQIAFERLSSALALDPKFSKALLGIGCITQTHQEFDVALSKYKLAIQDAPDSVALWNNIGMCFYSKQKYIAAISCLKRALWLAPLNWKVLTNLGLVHLSTLQPASAFNFLCAAVNLRPELGQTFLMLAHALLELKDTENAARALEQGLQQLPGDPSLLINSAACFVSCGLKDRAAEVYRNYKSVQGHDATGNVKEFMELENCLEQIISLDTIRNGENTNHNNENGEKEEVETGRNDAKTANNGERVLGTDEV